MTTPDPIEERTRRLVSELPAHIQAATGAALEAHMALDTLGRPPFNDVDLFDGQEGRDAMHELTEAMRHLRNARRIAEKRVEQLDEDES